MYVKYALLIHNLNKGRNMLFKIGSLSFQMGLLAIGLAVLTSFVGLLLPVHSPLIPPLVAFSELMNPAGGVAFLGILLKLSAKR